MLIPHTVWYDDANVVFRPELSLRNPIYSEELPAFNAFLSRLNLVLQNAGRHVADVALLYPIDSLYASHHLDGELGPYRGGVRVARSNYIEVGRLLSRRLGVDFRYVHPDTIEKRARVADGSLQVDGSIHPAAFTILILPSMSAIRRSTVDAVIALLGSGGHVIAVGDLPIVSSRCGDDGAPERLRAALRTHPNARVLPLDTDEAALGEAINSAIPSRDAVIDPAPDAGLIHKVYESRHHCLVANLSDAAREITVSLRGSYALDLWDPHTGEMERCAARYVPSSESTRTLVTIRLGPSRGVILVEQ